MIDQALTFLRAELGDYLSQRLNSATVELSRLVDDEGNPAFTANVGMALIRVDEERVFANKRRTQIEDDSVTYLTQPEQVFALHVMFVARQTNKQEDGYTEALRSLSAVAGFFQSHRSFTPATSPRMANTGLVKLNLELETVSYEVQDNIWGALGGKLLPSLLYIVRLVAIDELNMAGTADLIDNINVRSAHE